MGDAGACQTSNKKEYDEEEDESAPPALDEGDIALLKTYGLGPYTTSIKNIEKEITEAKVSACPHVFVYCCVRCVVFCGLRSCPTSSSSGCFRCTRVPTKLHLSVVRAYVLVYNRGARGTEPSEPSLV